MSEKTINKHLNCKSIGDLVEYIQNSVNKTMSYGEEFEIVSAQGNAIAGYYNDAYFYIDYEYGRRCSLMVDVEFPETMNIMRRILTPVMWVVDPKTKAPRKWTSPILSYETDDGRAILEWDNFDPIGKLNAVVYDYNHGLKVKDLQIYYPGITLESFKDDYLFGKYTGFFPFNVSEVDKYSEFQLFYSIFSFSELYRDYMSAAKLLNMNIDSKLEELTYMYNYLLTKTEKFGIKSHKPSKEPFLMTKQQEDWYNWWIDAFGKKLQANPYLLKEWKQKYPKTHVDPEFHPEITLEEFVKNKETRPISLINKNIFNEKWKLNKIYKEIKEQGPGYMYSEVVSEENEK